MGERGWMTAKPVQEKQHLIDCLCGNRLGVWLPIQGLVNEALEGLTFDRSMRCRCRRSYRTVFDHIRSIVTEGTWIYVHEAERGNARLCSY